MHTSYGRQAGAALCALLAAAASAQRLEQAVAPLPGSSFLLERIERGSAGERRLEILNDVLVVHVEGRRMLAFATFDVLLLYAAPGAFAGLASRDGTLIASWDPPVAFHYPLEVGTRWKQQGRVTFHQQPRTEAFEVDAHVEALEDVTVPAGTFPAFRIRSTDLDGTVHLDWLSPQLGIYVKRLIQRGAAQVETILKWHDIRLPR